MSAAQLRRWCLERPGASEEFPFGAEVSVFKAGGKMFAISSLGSRPLEVSLKCEPELGEQLRLSYPAIRPGYHLNKRHWITLTLDRTLPAAMVRGLSEDSHELVLGGLPRAKQREILGRTLEPAR